LLTFDNYTAEIRLAVRQNACAGGAFIGRAAPLPNDSLHIHSVGSIWPRVRRQKKEHASNKPFLMFDMHTAGED